MLALVNARAVLRGLHCFESYEDSVRNDTVSCREMLQMAKLGGTSVRRNTGHYCSSHIAESACSRCLR
jgi:hypothetical protein